MLRLKTNLDDINRFDVEAGSELVDSGNGAQGTWVAKNGDTLNLPSEGDMNVLQIFTESFRDGTEGKWSPDASASGLTQLTVLWGKYRAVSDQYAGTPTAGDLLKVNANGELAATTKASDNAVAVCTKGVHSETHLREETNVIEYLTL